LADIKEGSSQRDELRTKEWSRKGVWEIIQKTREER